MRRALAGFKRIDVGSSGGGMGHASSLSQLLSAMKWGRIKRFGVGKANKTESGVPHARTLKSAEIYPCRLSPRR